MGLVPSVCMDQIRSTFHHMPSWQKSSKEGSVGENWKWFSQSVSCWRSVVILPVLRSIVNMVIG